MKQRFVIFSLALVLSASGFLRHFPNAAAQDAPVSVPEPGKIRSIGTGYSATGEFSRFVFIGEDGRGHHWLEVWKAKNNADPNVVNYVMQPRSIITWGRGPILEETFNRQCLPSPRPKFDEKDYWVVMIDGLQLEFRRLDNEEDKNVVKGIFSNLQGAATQSRAGGLLNTTRHVSMWETNIISRFQKGKRQWIKPEWVQPLTACVRIMS
jgi:hypothetical protein